MGRMIHRLCIGFIAMIVAMSMWLSPANAVAMIDCEVQQPRLAADLAGHSDHVDHVSAEHDQGGAGLFSEHCAAHACVVATESASNAAAIVPAVQGEELKIHDGSLVAVSVPEGLRRPPRA